MTDQLGNTKLDHLEGRVKRLEQIAEDLEWVNSELRKEIRELRVWQEVEQQNRELLP